ncbi:RHS repeat-associated core domain-containing protein [Bacillus mycoides]|nr:RHS repeat-associated core domain-containing protein [Bacillus mycoides]
MHNRFLFKKATYEYDVWGNVLKSDAKGIAADSPFGYAGYMYDKEISMYYLMARYYHPEHSVFLSVDPDPGDEDDPITQNAYTYAHNNPVMKVDADGNHPVIVAGVLAYRGYKAYKTYKKVTKVAKAAKNVKKVHGNSKNSQNRQHGYQIYSYNKKGKKVVHKVGVSGGKLNKNGTSRRANKQASDWEKSTGYQKYHAKVVVKNVKNRRMILNWERNYANKMRKAKQPMNRHVRP